MKWSPFEGILFVARKLLLPFTDNQHLKSVLPHL